MTTMRRSGAVSVAVLIGLSASMATAHAIAPDWTRRAGLDVWNLPSLEEQLRQTSDERDTVNACAEEAARRRETANQIALRLADGMPMPAAVDEMMEVLQNDRGYACSLQTAYPTAPTPRHRMALHAINRVTRLLQDDPARCAAVVARLEAEYKTFDASPESPRPLK